MEHVQIAIIGAGFGGLGAAIRRVRKFRPAEYLCEARHAGSRVPDAA